MPPEYNAQADEILIGQVTHQWAQKQNISSHYYKIIDSTNLKAKAEAFNETSFNEQLILYIAEAQSAGKGRGQNTWANAPLKGSQLLSTWSFMINSSPHPTLSPMMGLALYRASVSTWPFLNLNLKAPNDLYIDDKKIAGLLLETVSQGEDHRLLIGLGLNVFSTPDAVSGATSLTQQLSERTPLLAQDWISFLERFLFEISFSLQLAFEPMNSTSTMALLTALNKHPLLKETYTELDEFGNLKTPTKNISWLEL